jgi:hypothetical protein
VTHHIKNKKQPFFSHFQSSIMYDGLLRGKAWVNGGSWVLIVTEKAYQNLIKILSKEQLPLPLGHLGLSGLKSFLLML